MKKQIANVFMALMLIFSMAAPVFAEEPPVKKSNTGICHPKGGTYYDRTKNYTPFDSMEECIKSGGRAPKR